MTETRVHLRQTQNDVANALRETWDALDQNPSITKEGVLHILAVKLSSVFNVYPEYSEAEFFDAIEGETEKTGREDADSRLIAAAPELLAFVRKIAPVLQGIGPAFPSELWQEMWALIDKAEGKP